MIDDIASDPELSFVRACLGACLFQDGPELIPPSNLDWGRFYDLLTRNKLVGLFYKLGKSHPSLWPDPMAEKLHIACYHLETYGVWGENQARRVLTGLRQENIPAIVLKGWAMVQILYEGEFNQRPSGDIDVLVKPGDLDRVDAILKRLGYVDAAVEPWPGFFQRYMNSRHYLLPQGKDQNGQTFHVDIHWGIPDAPYYHFGASMAPFFERSRPVKIADMEAGCLAMEDALIYACSHIAHHGYATSLSNYYEIATILLRVGPALDWTAVFSRASALRVVLPVRRVLGRVAALWPGVISLEFMETLGEQKSTRAERRLDQWVVRSNGRERMLGMLAWFTTPGVFRKVGYILETLIPGPAYLKEYFGPAPLGLWPLLYPWRVLVIVFHRFR